MRPKKEEHDWTEDVEENLSLPLGETTFEITGEPDVYEGDYGKRLAIPTNLGVWRVSLRSPIARKLKEAKEKIGQISHITLTVVRTGEKAETRYDIKNMVLPQQRQHTQPPKNQTMLNLENLTPEQKQQLREILNPNPEAATETT